MSLGQFIHNGSAYRIHTPKTPQRWYNYLFNDTYLLDVSQTLQGKSGFMNGYNKIDYTTGGRYFYVLDRETKAVFSPLYTPLKSAYDAYSCEHHLGHSAVTMRHGGLTTKVRAFVPVQGTLELWTVTVTNTGEQAKSLSLFSAIPFENSGPMGGECRYLHDDKFLYKYSFPYHVRYEDKEKVQNNQAYYFMFSDVDINSFDGSAQRFFGGDDAAELPAAVERGQCSNMDGEGEPEFTGAFEHRFTVAAGGAFSVNLVIGAARSIDEIREYRREWGTAEAIEREADNVNKLWEERCASYHIETPDTDFNAMINYWIKKQVIFLTRLNRVSAYCPVRNQLQDALGYSMIEPDEALEFALRVLRRQHNDGFLQQWYMTDGSAPKSLCLLKHGDAGLWLVLCVIEIIEKCGDRTLYERVEPYINGGQDSIKNHLLKAAYYLAEAVGERGLCLMLDGDWTDPINGAGRRGRGESTWSSMALLYCVQLLGTVCEHTNDGENARQLKAIAKKLDDSINTHCWDGDWYVAGIDDDGKPFGSHRDAEGKLFLNAQTWAIISGAAKGERLEKTVKAIEKLETDFGSLLLVPAFSQWNAVWGRISIKQKGTTENGSVYCHGTMFKAFADTIRGDGDAAYQAIVKTLPVNPRNPPERNLQVPLFVPNYYFGLQDAPNFGRSSNHYGTGTAAWMIWVAIEHMAGIRATAEGIKAVTPNLPKNWKEITVSRRYRGKPYSFVVKASSKSGI
jgi:cellobiose phosphorylase/cellobionic acid phosphorylase